MTWPRTRSEISGRTPARAISVLAVRRRSWIVQFGSGSALVPLVTPFCMHDRTALSSLALDFPNPVNGVRAFDGNTYSHFSLVDCASMRARASRDNGTKLGRFV